MCLVTLCLHTNVYHKNVKLFTFYSTFTLHIHLVPLWHSSVKYLWGNAKKTTTTQLSKIKTLLSSCFPACSDFSRQLGAPKGPGNLGEELWDAGGAPGQLSWSREQNSWTYNKNVAKPVRLPDRKSLVFFTLIGLHIAHSINYCNYILQVGRLMDSEI